MRVSLTTIAMAMMAMLGCEGRPGEPAATSDKAEQALGHGPLSGASGAGDDSSSSPMGTDSLHDEGAARPQAAPLEPEVARPSFEPPVAGQVVQVPSGVLLLGSPVDDPLRVQFAEADQVKVEIRGFEMDALPYPNDPAAPPQTSVTLEQAQGLCAAQGKRLCTDVEWEWACESADARRYPSGQRYDAADYPTPDPLLPASPLGVFAFGRLQEWTSSSFGLEADPDDKVSVRGYAGNSGVSEQAGRRCAFRQARLRTESSEDLGFRCCRGEPNDVRQELEKVRAPFSLYNNMKPEKFEQVIRSVPQIAAVHDGPRMFSDADIRTVMARRGTDRGELGKGGIHFVWKPMRWIPRQGMELWVAVGRGERHSFIVALHEVEDNNVYVHASSLILWSQPMPIALGYREGHRDELYWAPCWGCRDGGVISFDDASGQVVITHKW
ncbi:MAG: SUMF1/EgtB/PvdO family nonheme iron enzyme [Myxococcota bacterium]|nr:SUMF1/EgtB/PvdO family nonheme iron enzyme [Myxococcota bacterium]